MKRTVKAWALLEGKRLSLCYRSYEATKRAANECYLSVVPCTITYDDGTKPKRRRKPHA